MLLQHIAITILFKIGNVGLLAQQILDFKHL
jgi:hypothetical protein